MTGGSEFNEVFLTDAKVSAVNLTGGAGDGRKVLQSALDVERRGTGETTRVGRDIDDAAESPLLTRSRDLISDAPPPGRPR